jgi:hypothetical protein
VLGGWLWLFLLWSPLSGIACRYNVRDVGFVDLETERYHLYCYVRRETPAETMMAFRRAAAEALRDSNVEFEVIEVESPTAHPALAHHATVASEPHPAAVLVSPDGQSLPLKLPASGADLAAALSGAFDELVSSPLREAIVAGVSRAFGTVLLIEGTDVQANERARAAIAEALEQIRAGMKSLPKAIAEPPALVVLDAVALAREKVLLWSLRLDAKPQEIPRAAVVYGKARWIGPMMNGEEISLRNLVGIFSIIGADCECGLDLAWTQGTRLPVRWGEALRARLAKGLGFDPESPVVQTEVSWILGRRGSSSGTAPAGSRVEGQPPAQAAGMMAATASPAAVGQRVTDEPATDVGPGALGSTWRVLGVLAVLVLLAGGGLWWRAVATRRE